MDTEKTQRVFVRPIIPVLLSYMCGIVVGLYMPLVPGLFWVLWGICLFSLVVATRGRPAHLSPFVLFFVLGCWNLQGRAEPKLSANHIANFIDDGYWHIIGTIEDSPQKRPDRTRFIMHTESLTRGGKSYSVIGSVRITVREPVENINKGDRIACLARLNGLGNFNNPGRFDYKRYMAFRDVWASAFVSKQDLLVRLHSTDRGRIWDIADQARAAVSTLIEKLPPQDARAVLKALVIGDRSEIPSHTGETLSRIGSAHLLAISGLHIGMIATLAFFFFRLLLSYSERVLLAAWCARGAALVSVAPVLLYGFLAGMSPSTQRAVIMTMVFLLALLLELEQDGMNTLAAAAMVILVINPTALFEVSFQLSFAAVFSILFVLKNLSFISRLRSSPRSLLKRLALFVLVSTTAILGTLPVTLYYFNQVSLIGPLANCILIPLVGFLVVPLGLLAVLFLPVSEPVSLFLMKGAILALRGGLGVGDLFAQIPFAAVNMVTPSVLEIGLYYALAWALFKLRTTKMAKMALFVVVLAGLADVAYWAQKRLFPGNLTITVLDVGQGQAVLIELPNGKCLLVDGGGFHENRFDVGKSVVAPLLWRKKIATVEILVLSHPHPDHLNGLMFVARHFNVQKLWTNREPVRSPEHQELFDIASRKNIQVLGADELGKPQRMGGVVFEVLYPPPDFLKQKNRDGWRTPNNNSLVLKVTLNAISFLLPGDIEAEAEGELAALAGKALKSDVLVIPHHGSKTSSTPKFLSLADPAVAVISSGSKNPGLPHKKIVARYNACGCRVFCTNQSGAISLITDGSCLKVEPYLADRQPGLLR